MTPEELENEIARKEMLAEQLKKEELELQKKTEPKEYLPFYPSYAAERYAKFRSLEGICEPFNWGWREEDK